MNLVSVIGLMLVGLATRVTAQATEQYCQSETFRPRCHHGEAVIITKAVYGRMTFDSRCLQGEEEVPALANDPKYIGCFEDVLQLVSRRCSGSTECEMRVHDLQAETINPCYSNMFKYLEVSYHCIKVVQPDRDCQVDVSPSSVFLSTASQTSSTDGSAAISPCGSRDRPWLLEAPSGQRINVSLLDFTASSSTSNRPTQTDVQQQQQQQHQSTSSDCQRELGFIEDKSGKRNVNICTYSTRRQRTLHLSTSNQLAIVLTSSESERSEAVTDNFLISAQAVGCSDVVAPRDAWLKRVDNVATVGCYMTRQMWILTCDQRRSRWTGTFGNCTQQLQAISHSEKDGHAISAESKSPPDNNTQVMLLVLIIGVSVLVCIVIVLVGTTWLCRNARRKSRGRGYSGSDLLASQQLKSDVDCNQTLRGV